MSDFSDTNILRKIYNAIVNPVKPTLIRGTQKWRDDFSGNALSGNWEVLNLGNGQVLEVANSELKLSAGLIANSTTVIRTKKSFSIPCRVFFIYYLSQRIVNQEFYLEVVDSSGSHYARFLLSQASTGTAIIQHANAGFPGTPQAISILNSNAYTTLELDMGIDELKFCCRQLDNNAFRQNSIPRNRRLPDPNLEYFIQIRAINLNLPPSNNTNLFLESISYQSVELISTDVTASRAGNLASESIPVRVVSSIDVSGSVSISDGGGNNIEPSTSLNANGVYTGSTRSGNGRNSLTVTVQVDQPGILIVEQTIDNTLYINYETNNCNPGVNTFDIKLNLANYRIKYINGANAQGIFRVFIRSRT